MKLNWGQSIALFYLLFMLIMITMVVRASQNSVELVQDNYYDKDLNYESFRESRSNGARIKSQVDITYDRPNQQVIVSFPPAHEIQAGSILLYRPSNNKLDQKFDLSLVQDQLMKLSTENLPKGNWRIQLTWKAGEKDYHLEESLML